jgi:hypothetical protein
LLAKCPFPCQCDALIQSGTSKNGAPDLEGHHDPDCAPNAEAEVDQECLLIHQET